MTSITVKPNLQLIYVSDIERSTNFYKMLFQAEPILATPRYVSFSAGGEAFFAIWSGGEAPDPEAKRYSEIGILLPSNEAVDRLYEEWKQNPEIQAEEPYDEVFGRTFFVKDPDGHLIRVSPVD